MADVASQRIGKVAADPKAHLRPYVGTASARDGIKLFLRAQGVGPGSSVLLPAYVGWSAREGSGVLDPILELGATPVFHRMDRRLNIDLDAFGAAIKQSPAAVLLIHFFGRPDPNFKRCAAIARQAGVPVLEDEAHAMLTDLVQGRCGREGEGAVFSLHKLLPVPTGGALVWNKPDASVREPTEDPFRFDLAAIALRRSENWKRLAAALEPHKSLVEPLWPGDLDFVPQTFPVVIERVDRDALYDQMNAAGFGVVSLYHTMVEPIDREDFPDSHWLSRRILNLPVHQDVDSDEIQPMVDRLADLVRA